MKIAFHCDEGIYSEFNPDFICQGLMGIEKALT